MGLFKSVEADADLMREGEYEVYVKDCRFSETKAGTECIKFEFVVRSDVQQPYQNKHEFKQFYRDYETGEWPFEKIGKYANALGVPKDQSFDLDDLIGLNCIMVIRHYQDKKTNETKHCIFYLKPSKAENYISPANNFEDIDENDGEVPF